MAVTRLDILARTPYAGGQAFGEAVAYEQIDGVLHLTVEPEHEANRAIVDLDRALRGPDGRVHFSTDFCLLQPVDRARQPPPALRGTQPGPQARPAHAQPRPARTGRRRRARRSSRCSIPATASSFRHDLVAGLVRLAVGCHPRRCADGPGSPGSPLRSPGIARHRWSGRCRSPSSRTSSPTSGCWPIASTSPTPPPTADPTATLSVAEWPGGTFAAIPRDRWRFARLSENGPEAADTHVWLDDGFQPGRVYTLVYRTRRCRWSAPGSAMRDTIAWLRHGDAASGNPAAGRLDHTFAYGMSQSGRFLRHYLYLGLNQDEAGGVSATASSATSPGRSAASSTTATPNRRRCTRRISATLPPFADDATAEGPGC